MIAVTLLGSTANAVDWGLKEGTLKLHSAGPLAFGPDGVLFVGDPKAATIYAIDTGAKPASSEDLKINIEDLGKRLADALKAKQVTVNDLAVNPENAQIFLSVTADDSPALVRISPELKITAVSLEKVAFSQVALPDAPDDAVVGEGRRRGNPRLESITDLAYVEGKVLVSGLTNASAPSAVRQIQFPFAEADQGTNVEIYHAAHGRSEDNATVRTFVPFTIDGEPNILAGFTCTPLVKFPVDELAPGKKIRGTTVAELGNRNRPIDMIVYEQDGKRFLLMANSARGVMKIDTTDIERNEGLNKPVTGGGTAGQKYETVQDLKNVTQLDKLNNLSAVIIAQAESGPMQLLTVPLP
jgi:hypothetical protein